MSGDRAGTLLLQLGPKILQNEDFPGRRKSTELIVMLYSIPYLPDYFRNFAPPGHDEKV